MKKDERVVYLDKKEDIDNIIELLNKYSFDELKKSEYYKESLLIKGTDESVLKKIYPQFYRIKLIGLRKRRNNNENYDVYYELDQGYAVVFAIDIQKEPPELINGFLFHKNLRKFIEYVFKYVHIE